MKKTLSFFAACCVIALAVSQVSAQQFDRVSPTVSPYYPPPPPPPPTAMHLDAGDIITSINGQQIYNVNSFLNAVNSSGQIMYFTVQDNATGRPFDLATRLDARGYRMGVYVMENNGYGVRVTGLMPNSAAFRCWVAGPMPAPNPNPWPNPYPGPVPAIGAGASAPGVGVGVGVGTSAPRQDSYQPNVGVGVGMGVGVGTPAPTASPNAVRNQRFSPMRPGPVVSPQQFSNPATVAPSSIPGL